jgi:hypothetical protein
MFPIDMPPTDGPSSLAPDLQEVHITAPQNVAPSRSRKLINVRFLSQGRMRVGGIDRAFPFRNAWLSRLSFDCSTARASAFVLRMRTAHVSGELALVPTDHYFLYLGPGILPKPPGIRQVTSPPILGRGVGVIPSHLPPQASDLL